MNDYMIDPEIYARPLSVGGHASRDQGTCLLEWQAWLAGEEHSDHPACVSPVLGAFGRRINDVLPDELRQQLKISGRDALGTAGDGRDETRSYMALDWLIRTWLPAWLDLVPACCEDAATLRDLGRVVDLVSAERAGPVVRGAQERAAAAWATAWATAGATAGAAERDTAWDAAWDAAAWDTAWDAAWRSAGAGDGAWAAGREAEGAAAGAAGRDAARAAAGAAGRDALQPVVTALQQSAIELYSTMVRVTQTYDQTSVRDVR